MNHDWYDRPNYDGDRKNWQDWNNNQITFDRIDLHRIEIYTTILDAFSNNIVFYLDEDSNSFTLTDLGETYQNIQENTSFNNDPQDIIAKISAKYQVKFKRNILEMTDISLTELGPKIRDFGQMILEITLLNTN